MKTFISVLIVIPALLFCPGCTKPKSTHNTEESTDSDPVISNHWGNAETKNLELEEFRVFTAREGFAYNHHPQITSYRGRLLATWSSGIFNEDEPRQVMMLAFSDNDGNTWSAPITLFDRKKGKYNDLVHTSEGILPLGDMLYAFCGVDDYEAPYTILQDSIFPDQTKGRKLPYQLVKTDEYRTEIKTSVDGGISWSEAHVAIGDFIPNLKPVMTSSGRLIIPGNMSFPYTDGSPVSEEWKMSQVEGLPDQFIDAPRRFSEVQKEAGFPFEFCEASVVEMEDKTLRALFRTKHFVLAISESRDNGINWSAPRLTKFTDAESRFELGRLPDGRYFVLSCPKPRSARTPLILAVSEDGINFDRHFVLGDEPGTKARIPGRWKYGRYGYASYHIRGDQMYVIYSINKEDIALCKFKLKELN